MFSIVYQYLQNRYRFSQSPAKCCQRLARFGQNGPTFLARLGHSLNLPPNRPKPKSESARFRAGGPEKATGSRVTSKDTIEYWIEFSPQTSRGSFSAVSTPIFASKYSLESSRRDLHNALLCTVLQTQNFSQKSPTFLRGWIIEFLIFFIFLRILVKICIFSANFWWNFVRISRQIPEKSNVCRFFNQICENK